MSNSFSNKVLTLMILLGLLAPFNLRAEDVEFDTSMAQARVFVKKGWYREAVKELRRAVSTPQGEKNFDAHLLLAQACYKELDIGCALNVAETARGLARSPEERASSQGMLDYLQRNFGKVEFQAGPGEQTEGYLELKPLDPILDKDVKQYFSQKVAPLADQRRTLPWIMYLPAVSYKLYGKEFTVEGGKEMTVTAGFTLENSAPKPEKAPPPPEFEGLGIALQLRLGGGLALSSLSAGDAAYGAAADLSLHKSLGERLLVGVFAKFNYDLGVRTNSALTYGALGTIRLPLAGHLALLPAVGYALGEGPAWTFSGCDAQLVNDQETVICGDSNAEGTISAVVRSQMHGPVARVELAYERRSTRTIVSGQLGVQAHYGLSGTVVSGYGSYEDGASDIPFIVPDDFTVHPLRVELLAGLNTVF